MLSLRPAPGHITSCPYTTITSHLSSRVLAQSVSASSWTATTRQATDFLAIFSTLGSARSLTTSFAVYSRNRNSSLQSRCSQLHLKLLKPSACRHSSRQLLRDRIQ
ncbi:hypothetical protein BD414DRAFT_494205 [Trametes punicea]|nr:hypothetical protein BD414DRAFT_494205 [Trametes punicea]